MSHTTNAQNAQGAQGLVQAGAPVGSQATAQTAAPQVATAQITNTGEILIDPNAQINYIDPEANNLGFTPRLSFFGAVRSEFIKLLSLWSIKITLLLALVLGLAGSVLVYIGTKYAAENDPGQGLKMTDELLTTPLTFGSGLLAIFFIVYGVLAITNEYGKGLILSTMIAQPKRASIVLSKMIAVATISFTVSLAYSLLSFLIGWLILPKTLENGLTHSLPTALAGFLISMVGYSLFGFGIGLILRSTPGALTATVGFLMVVPPLVAIIAALSKQEWAKHVMAALISTRAQILGGGFNPALEMSYRQWWESLAVFSLWVIIPIMAGLFLFMKRDAK